MARPLADPEAEHTEERVLRAAEAEFGRRGYAAARLEDIGEAVGIRRASLLHHFESKHALYEAVVTRAFGRLGGALRDAMGGGHAFADRVARLTGTFMAFLDEHPRMCSLVVRELVEEQGPGRALLLAQGVPLLDDVVRFLSEGRARGGAPVPIRGAVVSLVMSALLERAAGDLRAPLWGADHQSDALMRFVFEAFEGGAP